MIDLNDLQSALKKQGLTLNDVLYIYSVDKGIFNIDDAPDNYVYVFTRDFVYVLSEYDGQRWFEAVPRSVDAAKTMKYYGDYGG